jgi:TadE-like protein
MTVVIFSQILPVQKMKVSNRRQQSGAALVELTIVLALFMVPLLMGLIEVSRLIYAYKTIVHQVHHTARYLSVQAPGQNWDFAKCLFKTGKLQSTCVDEDALLPGMKNVELTIEDAADSTSKRGISTGDTSYPSSVNVVTVTANKYPHQFIFSDLFSISSVIFGPVSATFRQVN